MYEDNSTLWKNVVRNCFFFYSTSGRKWRIFYHELTFFAISVVLYRFLFVVFCLFMLFWPNYQVTQIWCFVYFETLDSICVRKLLELWIVSCFCLCALFFTLNVSLFFIFLFSFISFILLYFHFLYLILFKCDWPWRKWLNVATLNSRMLFDIGGIFC